jgi:CheY-like chemotaxis protein
VPKQSRKRSGSASSPRRRAASKTAARSGGPAKKIAKILVVDDERDQRTVIFHSLRGAGYSVTEASDGEEALAKLRRSRFDLVVLDIMMPRMSGYEVLAKIRSMPRREETPVIVVTAKHDPEGVLREVSSGVTDHIAKPFLPSELEAMVERVLKGSHDVERERSKLGRNADVYGSVGELFKQARDE